MLDLYPYKGLINSDIREFVESIPGWENTCENANALDRLLDRVSENLEYFAMDCESEIDDLERQVAELESELNVLEKVA